MKQVVVVGGGASCHRSKANMADLFAQNETNSDGGLHGWLQSVPLPNTVLGKHYSSPNITR